MAKKCIYCSNEIREECVVDICQGCMYQVWGKKMADAIVSGMEKERNKGNMELGRVGEESSVIEKGFGKEISSGLDEKELELEFEAPKEVEEFQDKEEELEFEIRDVNNLIENPVEQPYSQDANEVVFRE